MIKNIKRIKPNFSNIKYFLFKNKIDFQRMSEDCTAFSNFIDDKIEKYGHFSFFGSDNQIELTSKVEKKYSEIEKDVIKETYDIDDNLIAVAYDYPQDIIGPYFSAQLEDEYQKMNNNCFHKMFKVGTINLPSVEKIIISNLDDSDKRIKYNFVPVVADVYQYGNSKYVRMKKEPSYNKDYVWYIFNPIEWIVDKENDLAITKKRITSCNFDIKMDHTFYNSIDKLLNEISIYSVEMDKDDNKTMDSINKLLQEREENVKHLKEERGYAVFDTKMLCDAVLYDKLTEIKNRLKVKYDYRFKNQEIAEALNIEHGNINHLSNLTVDTINKLKKIGNKDLLKYFMDFIEKERKIAFENYKKSFDIKQNDSCSNNYSYIIQKINLFNNNLDKFRPLVEFLDIFEFNKQNNSKKKNEAHIKLIDIRKKVVLSLNNNEINTMFNDFVKDEKDNIISILANYKGNEIDLDEMEQNLLLRISHLMDRIIRTKELAYANMNPSLSLIKK